MSLMQHTSSAGCPNWESSIHTTRPNKAYQLGKHTGSCAQIVPDQLLIQGLTLKLMASHPQLSSLPNASR